MNRRYPLLALTLLYLCTGLTGADTAKEEKFGDGTIKLKFTVDDAGKKQGAYVEFYPTGKNKLKATYKDDELDGLRTEYTEQGKVRLTANYKAGKLHGVSTELTDKGDKKQTLTYKDGQLDGKVVHYEGGVAILSVTFKADQVTFPRSEEVLTKTLRALDPPDKKKFDTEAEERTAALGRLKAYRYLCGVPYENIVLDDDMNKACLAGAKLCEKIGRLEHKPGNPGLPEADYKIAYLGTSKSNLYQGFPSLVRAVDSWMDDTDPTNIERVGHRRWCINPRLLKTGFGRSGQFAAMHSFDQSQKTVPDFDMVAYPPPGLMPVQYFGPRYAWNVSLNPQKYRLTDDNVDVKLWALDQYLAKTEPLKLSYSKPNRDPIGLAHCVIFQPEKIDLSPGKRYLVEIHGVKRADGKTPAPIRYLVEFFRLK